MKKIAVTVCILCLAVALLVTSLAWYQSNLTLSAKAPEMGAGKDISTSVVYLRVDSGKYNGQTGKGSALAEDAPYAVDFFVYVSNQTYQRDCRLFVDMKRLVVTRGNPEEPPYAAEDDAPYQNFTWRFTYRNKVYQPNEEGEAVDADGNFFQVEDGNVTLGFQLIYLSEQNYRKWQADVRDSRAAYDALPAPLSEYEDWVKTQPDYFAYDAFYYSDPKYMNTTFYFEIDWGIRETEVKDETE